MNENEATTAVRTPRRRRPPARPRTVRLPESYWDALEKLADEQAVTVNTLIVIAIRERWVIEEATT